MKNDAPSGSSKWWSPVAGAPGEGESSRAGRCAPSLAAGSGIRRRLFDSLCTVGSGASAGAPPRRRANRLRSVGWSRLPCRSWVPVGAAEVQAGGAGRASGGPSQATRLPAEGFPLAGGSSRETAWRSPRADRRGMAWSTPLRQGLTTEVCGRIARISTSTTASSAGSAIELPSMARAVAGAGQCWAHSGGSPCSLQVSLAVRRRPRVASHSPRLLEWVRQGVNKAGRL